MIHELIITIDFDDFFSKQFTTMRFRSNDLVFESKSYPKDKETIVKSEVIENREAKPSLVISFIISGSCCQTRNSSHSIIEKRTTKKKKQNI